MVLGHARVFPVPNAPSIDGSEQRVGTYAEEVTGGAEMGGCYVVVGSGDAVVFRTRVGG